MPRERYVDPENPWEDDDYMEQLAQTDTSGLAMRELLQECWDVTAPGRKRFKKPAEKGRWRKIEAQIQKGTIHEYWVKSCIHEWAAGMNKNSIVIDFPKLMTAILNKSAMTDWLERNPEAGKATIVKVAGPTVIKIDRDSPDD